MRYRAVKQSYHVEKIRNKETGREYFLKYKSGKERSRVINKMLKTMDSESAEGESAGDYSWDDFETVSDWSRKYADESFTAPDYMTPEDFENAR